MGLGGRYARRERTQRGAALLVVITSVAILTAVSVDLAYNTRVSLQSAANARDELKAYYLAKSAVAMSRLVLNFQQQVDARMNGASGAIGGIAQVRFGIRLWDLVPVDSSAAALFLGGAGGANRASFGPQPPAPILAAQAPPDQGAPASSAGTRRAFGDAEGSFHATIEDEDRKINIRQFDGIGNLALAQVARLADLVRDPKWDFLFNEDDANGIRVERKDLFAALKDWEDEDETSSAFTGIPTKPWENGFGDENGIYDRLEDRYKAKNAPYDSVDELFMVAGVSDAFMAAFGDKLTVYPDVSATINVNTDDPAQIMVNALLMSDPPGVPQPALLDPQFLGKLNAALILTKPLPFMAITPQQFASVLSSLGVKVQATYTQANNPNSAFGDRSSTFHIHAQGVAGDVTKRIDAVVTFDRRAQGLAQDTGRLLHWHEE